MKTGDQSISILTVTYNTKDFFEDYIKSIFSGTIKPAEVLLYDGGSTDGTVEVIKKHQKTHPEIALFQGENIGFAASNNLLARKASGNFLFLLNPDTKIDKDSLRYLIENSNNADSLIIPKQFFFDKRFLSHGVGMDILGYPTIGKPFYADGAAIFLSSELFKYLGMFDEDYYMFQEDIDLSWRAHLYGIKLVLDPKSCVFHYSGGTIDGGAKKKDNSFATNTFRRYYGERNIIINILKNYSFFALLIILPLVILSNLLEIILFSLMLKFKLVACYFRAYSWVISHLPAILRKRKIVQSKRKVSDLKIIPKMSFVSSKLKYFIQFGIPKIK